jgi:hypothetical protein
MLISLNDSLCKKCLHHESCAYLKTIQTTNRILKSNFERQCETPQVTIRLSSEVTLLSCSLRVIDEAASSSEDKS